MIETISHDSSVLAIIVYKSHHNAGIEFITPGEFSLQLGYMTRPAGYEIQPHVHNPIKRITTGTQEVLFIKSGVVQVDFFSADQVPISSRRLSAGDLILFAAGGHGVTVLEEAAIIEVKNGPYSSDTDKTKFLPKR